MTITKPSKEAQDQSIRVAKATQKPGQSKEQTKLIAQGIEKGIAVYKKQQSKKNRESDKAKKQALKHKRQASNEETSIDNEPDMSTPSYLPWILLIVSWLGFISYIYI